MKALLLVVVLLLAGCVTTQPCPVIPQEVIKVVPTRCKVKYPEAPAKLDPATLPADVKSRVVALIKEDDDYRAYAKELESALKACADDTP